MGKRARVKYYKDYPPFNEGYAIEIFDNGEWVLESFFALQHCTVDNLEDERNFIHFSILNAIGKLQMMGYYVQVL